MKPESLHALIIDRHLGELSPEAVELLEHHLAANAGARIEAERVLESLNITREAMLRHPELARVPVTAAAGQTASRRPSMMTWMARAAALLLAALAGAGGFLAGRLDTAGGKSTATATPGAPRKESPWARYRMTFDPAGEGMQVVRVDTDNLEKGSPR